MYKLHRLETNIPTSLSFEMTAQKQNKKNRSGNLRAYVFTENTQIFNSLTPSFSSEKTDSHTFNP